MALFDGLGAITGHIYADSIIKDMKGVTYPKAYQLFTDAYNSVNNGIGGFTKNDAKQLIKIAEAMGKQFGITEQTDPLVYQLNFIIDNDRFKDDVNLGLLQTHINDISPKTLTGSTTGNIVNGKASHDPNLTKAPQGVLEDSTKYNNISPSSSSSSSSSSNPSSGSGSGSGGTVKSTGGSPGVNTDYYEQLIAAQGKDLEKLEATIASLEEQLKPRSAQENAERYGIDYDEQHILDDYNTKTNEYFQNAIDEQEALRYQYAFNNARAAQQTLNDYVDSYMNAAPTATKRGTIAANALGQYINSNYTNNLNDYGMAQSINQLGKDWDAELANNPALARQYYNSIGTYLSSLGANQHASDVKQYIDTLDAYSQAYAASRAASAYVAQGTANKYSGLANAAVANAQSNADKYNSFMQYYNWNLNAYGNNGKQASTGITNNLQNSAGYNKNT